MRGRAWGFFLGVVLLAAAAWMSMRYLAVQSAPLGGTIGRPTPMSLVELIARFNDSGGIRDVEVSGYCSATDGALALYLFPADAENGFHKNSVRLQPRDSSALVISACSGRFVTVRGRYDRGSRFASWSGVLEDAELVGGAPPPPAISEEDSLP